MSQPSAAHVTAAEISRIAGVTRATVSNWRRRHDDFPHPAGGTESSPLYDLDEVGAWLASRGHSTAGSPRAAFRTALRLHRRGRTENGAELLPLTLAAARPCADLTALAELPDATLAARATDEAGKLASEIPGVERTHFTSEDSTALRALLRCVRDESAQAALDVLAEHALEDSAASGTYQTPAPLADLAARLLPSASARVLDPACGSGLLLEAAARHGATDLYGQDIRTLQAQRGTVSLKLTSPEARTRLREGDSLRADAFPGLTVDAVLCNPPYGDRDWGHDELAYDPRWVYGVPPRAEPELAWAQHALSHLTPAGWAVLILPPAVASRPSGRRVRAELVRDGVVRAVVALPPGAAPPQQVGLHLWVLQRPKPDGEVRKSVLFVDLAGSEPSPGGPTEVGRAAARSRTAASRTQAPWPELTARTLAHWKAFTTAPDDFPTVPGTARVVPLLDLLDDLVDLTPARQVRITPTDLDPAELAARAGARRGELAKATTSLLHTLDRTGWSATEPARTWRTATVSDLTRGGALTLLRATPHAKSARSVSSPGPEAGRLSPPRPILTGADIAHDTAPSGDPSESPSENAPVIAVGDLLIRAVAGGPGPVVRVADERDAGARIGSQVHLLRPDPTRLDPWFLAGFLASEGNVAGASTGSTTRHVTPGRLRVPLMPLEEQRRYGEAFRRVHVLRAEARRVAHLAEETAGLLADGLTGGAFGPPLAGTDQGPADSP